MANPQTAVETPLGTKTPLTIDGLSLAELPHLGKVTLRGDADNSAFAEAVKSVLGTDLPTDPMSSVEAGKLRIFWKAFDEWLIWTPSGGEGKLIADLRQALGEAAHAVVDISDYYTVIRVDGVLSRDLLAKGCALDLHPDVFTDGQVTGTGFHHATIFLTRAGENRFDVMIRWSYADYLWTYFTDGAREWGG